MAPNNLLAGVVDLKEFAETFPRRVNKILDAMGNNEIPDSELMRSMKR